MTSEPGPPTDLPDLAHLANVAAEQAEGGWTLVFVRDLRHPPEKVWAALTEPGRLREWAPFVSDRDLARTGPATLTMIDGDGPEDTAASVRRVEPPTLLEYTWGEDLLRWELEPTATGTRLVLRHTPKDRGIEPMLAAGWHLCLVVMERLLDGDPIGVVRGNEAREYGWEQLRDAYARRFAG
jgi:uncharacterized protein YndB with AHSA1/START domain